MYAIIEVAGKQYKVVKGMTLSVDKMAVETDQVIELDKVLLIKDKDTKIGQPYLEGAAVKAKVLDPEVKDKKVIVFKYKRKTGYHKKQGHRQRYTEMKIEDILLTGAKKKADKTVAAESKASAVKEAKVTKSKSVKQAEVKTPTKKAAPKKTDAVEKKAPPKKAAPKKTAPPKSTASTKATAAANKKPATKKAPAKKTTKKTDSKEA